ncbi:MAG: hypothetical protein GX633_10360 [Clostridiales bacterium]|nr:hypothetical protein [Clostridiales bacterium]
MKRALTIIIRCVWGFPQTLLGAVIFLLNVGREWRFERDTIISLWKLPGCVSLGLFIFLCPKHFDGEDSFSNCILHHELGHCVQSLILGPLYLIIIGLPSALWAAFPKLRGNKPYEYLYTEKWADKLGERLWIKK